MCDVGGVPLHLEQMRWKSHTDLFLTTNGEDDGGGEGSSNFGGGFSETRRLDSGIRHRSH